MKQIFFYGRVENIAGKGENAGYKHFLLFSQCFQKASFPGSLSGKGFKGKKAMAQSDHLPVFKTF